jgi:transposase
MGAAAAPPLEGTTAEVDALRSIVRAGTSEQRAVTRARIVLLAAEGVANTRIARRVGVSLPTVLLWRARFVEHGLDGLVDAPHPGRPRVYGRAVRDKIVAETLSPPAEPVTHWSRARLAERVGVSASTVGRVWREANLKPHRSETFKYSNDPELVEKVTDVVGLYVDPPERAIVLSVDEKTQVRALRCCRCVSCRHEASGAGTCGGHGVGGVVRSGAFCGPVAWRRESCWFGEALSGGLRGLAEPLGAQPNCSAPGASASSGSLPSQRPLETVKDQAETELESGFLVEGILGVLKRDACRERIAAAGDSREDLPSRLGAP